MKDYGTLSLSELKEELKSRGARLSGRKKELVERLESYDRNFNFGKANEVEKEYEMFLPPISSYRDINQDSDFPPVNLASVNAYLGFVGQEIDEKTKQLFDQRFLKYMRLAKDTDFYVRSECKAEMKKTVSCKVDVKIEKNGSIERTDRDKLALSLVKLPQELKTQPILHGKRCESVALQKYEKLTKVETTPCGTFVCAKYPYLASSPDAVIDDDRLVEVKCPYTARNEIITPETVPYLQEEHGQFSLKTTHPYYYQVQGQLLCSGRKQCVFILYTFEDLKFLIVQRDDEFIDQKTQIVL
ncbi:hypothetical protein ScPMuIL_008719 [Solemya velum]